MEYIKISRTSPAMYKAVNATGWLCDVYQPVDEQYLGSVWGGGTYVIVAYQNMGGGGPREVARGYTQINGNPRAYRGTDGNPVLFPVDGSENRPTLPGIAPPPVQNPAAVMPMANGLPFPTSNGMPLPQAPSLDLMALAEKFSAAKQDNKSLEVIQAAQQQNAEFYRSIMDKSSDEQRQLRDQLIALQQQQAAPMQNAIEMYRAQMETRERSHNEVMKQITAEHAAQLNAIRLQSDKAIEEQRRAHEAVLINYREEARSRETSMRDAWRVETDNLRRELDNSRQTNLGEMQRIREANAAEIQRIRDDHRRDLDQARAELERERTTLTNELNRVRDEYRRDQDNARQEMDRREVTVRDSSRVLYEAQIKTLEAQVATVREQLEQRLQDARQTRDHQEQTLKTTFDLQLQQRDNEIARLRDELSTARTETVTLRTELGEKRDPMNTLNEVATLTQTFQSITGQGGNNNGPREEEPKTFMAQLAKFAPAIGEHLIKPTMKPISEVVETVRERDRREEELRRDILLRRQAMQQQRGAGAPAGGQQLAMQQAAQQHAALQQQAALQQRQAFMAQQQQAAAWQRQQQQLAMQQYASTVPAPVLQPKPRVRPLPAQVGNDAVNETAQYDAVESSADGSAQEPLTPEMMSDAMANAAATELAASPLNSLITKDLIDYIENAMRSNTTAEDLAGQLTSAVSFGMIEAALLEQVKSTPVATVVELFAVGAEQYGASTLSSPRGEEYIAAIHATLNR
jgi:hypothetical protein